MNQGRTLQESLRRVAMHIVRTDTEGMYRIMGTGTCYSMIGSIIRNPNSMDVGEAYRLASVVCKERRKTVPDFNGDISIVSDKELVEIAKLCVPYYWPTRTKLYYKNIHSFEQDYQHLCKAAGL